jgi:hypothetical protein
MATLPSAAICGLQKERLQTFERLVYPETIAGAGK